MPSLITHYMFGQDVYQTYSTTIGQTETERHLYLLGNQGPDPLFYGAVLPAFKKCADLGHRMHCETPAKLINALKQSIDMLPEHDKPLGRAYALGFLSHWLLDSNEHPLIFYWEGSICNSGEPGLAPRDHREVHAAIETEIDEMMLFTRLGKTVSEFKPQDEVLKSSTHALHVVDKMYRYMALMVYGYNVPKQYFSACVKAFRIGQTAFYSPDGGRRSVISRLEHKFRPHSFYGAMSHRDAQTTEVPWENNEHNTWIDPDTQAKRDESFKELFEQAYARARVTFDTFLSDAFDLDAARAITKNINFEGCRAE